MAKKMQPFPSHEDLSALSATIELSGLETEYLDFGVFIVKDDGNRIGEIGLSEDEFPGAPWGGVDFTYRMMIPVGNGFKVLEEDVRVRSRRQFYKELDKLNQQLNRSFAPPSLLKPRRKNPIATGTLLALGLGYFLGSKK